MSKSTYIDLLPYEVRQLVYLGLLSLELSNEDIENTMSSRLCELSDTIDISKYI